MDRALLLEHREQTLERLAESERQLARQEELIARLHSEGRPTSEAEAFLSLFERVNDSHRVGLARIERELAVPPHPLLD
jgi:hypothetical protein